MAVPALVMAEAENNLPLGICAWLRSSPLSSEPPPYLATAEDGERIVAVAMMVPPFKLVLSMGPRTALEPICADLQAVGIEVPGVVGPKLMAEAFSEIWEARTGIAAQRERALRIYRLTTLTPPRTVAGAARQARADEVDLLTSWGHAFVTENALTDDAPSIAARIRQSVAEGRIYVWDADGPVSMAGWAGPTPNGARVTLVYTPPALRGRGYASACVAALSAMLLATGRKYCFLFTDLANPTSNSIYTKLGYRPVCDVAEYRFARGLHRDSKDETEAA